MIRSKGEAGTGNIVEAVRHLRSILGFLNSPQMNSPEAYIQFKDGMINDAGEIADPSTVEFLGKYLKAFHDHIAHVLSKPSDS